jgi:hypothetical protein
MKRSILTREEEWVLRAGSNTALPSGFHLLLATATDSYFLLKEMLALLKKWDGESDGMKTPWEDGPNEKRPGAV